MRARREQLDLTQTELGLKVGISQPVVSAMERGDNASSKAVAAISDYLGLPMPYIELQDKDEERILKACRAIREANPELLAQQVQLLESIAQGLARRLTPKG
jgi:transcriptional regulator with XRE-family HTH domain